MSAAQTPARIHSTQSDMGCNALKVDGVVFASQVAPANPGPNPSAAHAWERAGLGVAPYRLIGVGEMSYRACPEAPSQPGAACDYCGQGIRNVYSVRAACGSVFKVGCDCVRKACDKSEKVAAEVEKAARKHAREVSAARRASKAASVQDALEILREEQAERLASLPHPKAAEWPSLQGKTALDWLDYMIERCGAAGRAKLLKAAQALLVGAPVGGHVGAKSCALR